jgi:hypothetical protein
VISSVVQSVQAHIATLSFTEALALFPVAVMLHVYEEWPRFPQWARRFTSATYSDRDYIVTHAIAIVAAIASVILLRTFPSRAMLFVFLAVVFGPGAFCNAWFHIGGTILSGTYCPGAITGLMLYVPLSALLVVLGLRDGLFTGRLILLALAVAATLHTIEVSHNVFKRW